MQNFTLWSPTKILFGNDMLARLGEETRVHGQKALLVYGQQSLKRSGVYDRVVESLRAAGLEIIEFSGVKSNPVVSHVRQGVALAKHAQVDVIVAAGGGSVLDEAKAIAAGAKTERDVWDFAVGKAELHDALPVLTVLTLAAAGSEMNCCGVLTNEETQQKTGLIAPCLSPKVSILDPTATYTVPRDYTVYGAIDAISHLLEFYFTAEDAWTPIQDSLVEGVVKAVMASLDKVLDDPADYQGRATLMWAASLAGSDLPFSGVGKFTMPVHAIAHEIGALYDTPHGAAIAMITPGWMRSAARTAPAKFAQFAHRIFDIRTDDPADAAEQGIAALQAWFARIGAPTSLTTGRIPLTELDRIASHAAALAQLWNIPALTPAAIMDILTLCV